MSENANANATERPRFDWAAATKEERWAENRREQAEELAKIPMDLKMLFREQTQARIRKLREEIEQLEMVDAYASACRGVYVTPETLVASDLARACWPALSAATSKYGGGAAELSIHYHPSKQISAWQVLRGNTEWYISTDELAAAFAEVDR